MHAHSTGDITKYLQTGKIIWETENRGFNVTLKCIKKIEMKISEFNK